VIPYGRQSISEDDVAAVVAALRSDFLTQGPAVPGFEAAVADYCGAPHAIAVNSATSALHIGCLALGLGPGDWLWTSPNTFVASANCARYCGADVDFVDVDPVTYNMCPQRLAAKLEAAERAGRLPKVVVPVAFSGRACDMKAIATLARRYGFAVLDDASHAIGAEYDGSRSTCNAYADLTVFSFHPVKIITTAEGGIVLTHNPMLAERLRLFRSHGITRDVGQMKGASEGGWYYQQVDLGYNYRLTDLQAALGISQMRRLDQFIARRRQLVARYSQLLTDPRLTLPQADDAISHSAWHLYVVKVPALERRRIYDALRAAGIGVNVHYIPVHLQPYYRARGFEPGDFPEAERYYAGALSLPMFATLTDAQQDQVAAALTAALAS